MISLARDDELTVVAQRGLPPRARSLEKATLVLLAVSKPVAQQLLKYFDPIELDSIRAYASQLKSVNSGELATVIGDFERSFKAGARFVGTSNEITDLLESAASPAASEKTDPDPQPVEQAPPSIWTEVEKLAPEILQGFILLQHPQVGAWLVSQLRTDLAADVLALLDANSRNEILLRIVDIEDVSEAGQLVVEAALRAELLEKSSGDRKAVLSNLAGLLNRLDRAQTDEVLDQLARERPKDAQAVRRMLFSFEDLVRLPKKALATAVDSAPPDKLVRALVGTSDSFMESVLSVMSPRARRMVESELKAVASLTSKEVDAARREIAAGVLTLAASGALELVQDEG